MNYKPFDLQKALAGEPVAFRESGFTVAEIYFSKTRADLNYAPIFVIATNGRVYLFWEDGSRYKGCLNPFDLVMAPQKKTVFVNVYNSSITHGIVVGTTYTYDSEDAAKKAEGVNSFDYIGTYPIEIEL